MTASARARELVDHAVRLPQSWIRHLPANAQITIDAGEYYPAAQIDGGPLVPALEAGEEAIEVFLGSAGATMELDGDIPLTATEAGIEVDRRLAEVLDAAVDIARCPTHTAGQRTRDLRDALIRLGYLPSEVGP